MSSYPLSPIQQGMLYHHLRAPRSGVDIEQMVARLHEAIDPEAFRQAWRVTIARHGVFRTSFRWEGSEHPVQAEHECADMPWEHRDLRGVDPAERARLIEEFLRADRQRGFDLRQPPLTRGTLFQIDAEEWEFVWSFHHISADGQTYQGLIREAFACYEAIRRGDDPPVPEPTPRYRDYIVWLEARLRENRERAQSFWREALRGLAAPTALPRGSEIASVESAYAEQSLRLPANTTRDLRVFCDLQGVTMSTCVQAAWSLLLGAHSGENDVVFGETRACRRATAPGAETIIGTLINTVPVRIAIEPDQRVAEWLKSIRTRQIAVRAFEHTPLSEIQQWSELPANTPLFESLVVFTPRLVGAALREQGGAWENRDIDFLEQTNFPLTLFAYNEAELLLKLAYDRGRFTDATIGRCLRQLRTALEAMPQLSERPVSELPLLDAEERQILTVAWNATDRDYAKDKVIHRLFAEQARRTPDAVAVVFRDRSLTYAELDRRANQLAHRLQALGAGPDKLVGIFLDRSIEMVVALLGTLKSGAAYLPLDPAFPKERLAWMLEDAAAPIVLTQQDLASALPVGTRAKILCLDGAAAADLDAEPANDLGDTSRPYNLAYVIFTSGSSGRPKGVMIDHQNVVNFFAAMDERLGFREAGTWLAVTSISFDISVLELLWTLSRGFKVVIQDSAWLAPKRVGGSAAGRREMQFSLFYFAADAGGDSADDKYRLLLEGARYGDQHGFSAVWTPERHFHAFGGLYPNPALTSAAVAAITSRIGIRAGSVVLPLHNPIRIAEEWAVVDNLSRGRVGLSFASGWHANDFALMPQNYRDRRELTFRGIETIRRLWRGEAVKAESGSGEEIELRIFPPPLQRNPEIWVTAAGNVETFRAAGEIGANLLTNLLGQKVEDLAGKIEAYRKARREHGHAGDGTVTLMLHTYLGPTLEHVRAKVRRPFIEYLKTSTDLIKRAHWEFPAFFNASNRANAGQGEGELSAEDLDALMDHAFERYFQTSGLFGTADTCLAMVDRLQAIGVNEIACLIDFGVDADSVLESLSDLNKLRELCVPHEDAQQYSIANQMRRHGVTHFQCTPSLARLLTAEEESLAALRPLRKLLLGGEALPPSLAAQLASAIDGELINMYGPTETTVWSTTAAIPGNGEPITIGRPIANTRIYIVDKQMRLAPIGAAGELLIGGDGVTRGYLNRPDLTAERFIPDPFSADPGARLYRTGDRARYREDGRIEFLGRVDSQIKILGHRIEPGEIEAVLARHPSVRESVVIARENPAGEPAIVAYVAASPSSGDTRHWREIWDSTYGDAGTEGADPALNTVGWISSYTGKRIPEAEMREWVDCTVDRIKALEARRILEIGCGFGMLLLRLAPLCDRYHGIDFSAVAARYVAAEIDRQNLKQASVQCAAAHELSGLAAGSFDLVVLNSVIQYFPDVEYLVRVLEAVVPLIAPGGAIFIGDVRSLPLLEAFHTSVELAQAPADLAVAELRQRVQRRLDRDSELVLSPDFFAALRQHLPKVTQTQVLLKRGRWRNEMTCFRYDAILGIGGSAQAIAPPVSGATVTLEQLRDRLRARPPTMAFAGIPNARVAAATGAAALMASTDCPATAGELRERAGTSGIDPEDLYGLDPAYHVALTWSAESPGAFDAFFLRAAGSISAAISAVPEEPRRAWSDYANRRRPTPISSSLVLELRELATQQLPDYMVPAAFVVLDALPRTPNGKLDRKALPAPDKERVVTKIAFAAPQSELERTIAAVWQDLLNLERVGSNDNFFDLGANSLSMMRANARLREVLRRDLPLLDLFRYPSVGALAAHLARDSDDGAALDQSRQRGRARMDALRRRRHDARD